MRTRPGDTSPGMDDPCHQMDASGDPDGRLRLAGPALRRGAERASAPEFRGAIQAAASPAPPLAHPGS